MSRNDTDATWSPRTSEYRLSYDYSGPRGEFLAAIERIAPEVLESLYNGVFKAYLPLKPDSEEGYRQLFIDVDRQHDIFHTLRPQIDEWDDQFHLFGRARGTSKVESWMEPIITCTLISWGMTKPTKPYRWTHPEDLCADHRKSPEDSKYFAVGAHLFDTPDTLHIEIDGWPVLRETEKEFQDRADGVFQEVLKAYITDRIRRAEERGWVRTPPRTSAEHMDWLVMYHVKVKRLSHTQIAKEASKKVKRTRQAICDGINAAAELVAGPDYTTWLMPRQRAGQKPKAQT